jgi:hypothetical protein
MIGLRRPETCSDEHTDQQDRRRNKNKMAKGMGRVYKGRNNKRVFPKGA